MRSDHVGFDLPVRDQIQLDVDHVVSELPAVQEALRARVVEGEDVGQQDLRDLLRVRRRVAERLQGRLERLEVRLAVAVLRAALVGGLGDVEDVLLVAVVEDGVDRRPI